MPADVLAVHADVFKRDQNVFLILWLEVRNWRSFEGLPAVRVSAETRILENAPTSGGCGGG